MTAPLEEQALCPYCGGPGLAQRDRDSGSCNEDLDHFPFRCQRCDAVWHMPLRLYQRICHDCGRRVRENADDSQPGFCPRCASRRLRRVMQAYGRHVQEHGLSLACDWLALALKEDAGVTEAWAELHADELGAALNSR